MTVRANRVPLVGSGRSPVSIPHLRALSPSLAVFEIGDGGCFARALLPLPLFLCVGVLVVGLLGCAVLLWWVVHLWKTELRL